MWHTSTRGTPLEFCHSSSSTLNKREQDPAASSSWPGPTTRPSKPGSRKTPSVLSWLRKMPSRSWMETRVEYGWYFHHGTQGYLIPVLPYPKGPWGKYTKQLLLEPFMLGRSFPLAKTAWVSDFFTIGRAQGYALSRSVPGREVPALSLFTRNRPKFTTRQHLLCPVQIPSLNLWEVCIPFYLPFSQWQLS